MNKRLSIILVFVLVAAFVVGAMAPATHAVLPKEIKCWDECHAPHVVHCCKYSAKGVGTWVECEATIYYCFE